jgi:hypothetical protein
MCNSLILFRSKVTEQYGKFYKCLAEIRYLMKCMGLDHEAVTDVAVYLQQGGNTNLANCWICHTRATKSILTLLINRHNKIVLSFNKNNPISQNTKLLNQND